MQGVQSGHPRRSRAKPQSRGAARVCPPATCTRISTRIGRGGGGRIEDGPGREGEGGRTGRHEGGGWSDAARERGRSVGLRDPNFLRRAARGGPGRSAGQNRKRGARSETLRDPLTLPAAAAINQEMMPRQHIHGARRTSAPVCSRGWSDGPARRWWVVGQGGRTGEGDLGGGVVRQDVIRVQVPGGQTRAARRRAGEAEVHSTRQRRRQHGGYPWR